MRKPTKAIACPMTGRKPTKRQYEKAVVTKDLPLQDEIPEFPHKLPPYGGKCFVQAYNERMAYERMCQKERDYQASVSEYNTLWTATENCMNGIPV